MPNAPKRVAIDPSTTSHIAAPVSRFATTQPAKSPGTAEKENIGSTVSASEIRITMEQLIERLDKRELQRLIKLEEERKKAREAAGGNNGHNHSHGSSGMGGLGGSMGGMLGGGMGGMLGGMR